MITIPLWMLYVLIMGWVTTLVETLIIMINRSKIKFLEKRVQKIEESFASYLHRVDKKLEQKFRKDLEKAKVDNSPYK